MAVRRLTQVAAVAGAVVSVSLLFVLDSEIDNSWMSLTGRLFGWAFGIAIVAAPFAVAFVMAKRSPPDGLHLTLMLTAVVAGIIVAFIVRPNPDDPNGADGMQLVAASLYQGAFITIAAAASDFTRAVQKRRT